MTMVSDIGLWVRARADAWVLVVVLAVCEDEPAVVDVAEDDDVD